MIPFNLTALTRKNPLYFPQENPPKFYPKSFILSIFSPISRFISKIFSSITALQHFKKKTMTEIHSEFTFDEDQEMETQPIYLSSDESETGCPCASPIPQLPDNVRDTYSAMTQLIAAQHEQMSSSGNFDRQYPPTPPVSLISDDDNDEVFTTKIGNTAQLIPCTPNRRPHPIQLSQQLTPIPDTPESPIRKIVDNLTYVDRMIYPTH